MTPAMFRSTRLGLLAVGIPIAMPAATVAAPLITHPLKVVPESSRLLNGARAGVRLGDTRLVDKRANPHACCRHWNDQPRRPP